jgi:hypothetical protein
MVPFVFYSTIFYLILHFLFSFLAVDIGFLFSYIFNSYIFKPFVSVINWVTSIKPFFIKGNVSEIFVIFYYFVILLVGKSIIFFKNKER